MGNAHDFSLLFADDDYDAQPSRSFFAFNSTTDVRMCATVTIIDDDSYENDVENFFANLELASNAPRLWINTSQAEIQINDEDSTYLCCIMTVTIRLVRSTIYLNFFLFDYIFTYDCQCIST